MIRDNEIKRLILYGKALGVKITIRDYAFEEEGEIGDEPHVFININKRKHSSKTSLILTLLHELSHAKYINNTNGKISSAWILEEERKPGKKLSKKLRKEIADFELNSLNSMVDIAIDLKIQIPMNKILRQRDIDKWVYEYYLKIGEWPSELLLKNKLQEIIVRYK